MFDLDTLVGSCCGALRESEPLRAVREVLARALAEPGQVGSLSGRVLLSSIPWSTTFCIAPEFSIDLRRTTGMGRPATGPVAVLTFLLTSPAVSMAADSIRGFRRCFPDSSRAPSGGTAPNRGSTSATAIRSMIVADAQTCGVGCTAAVIDLYCVPRRKRPKNSRFLTLDFYYRLCIIAVAAID